MDNSTTTTPQGELLLASQLELVSPTTVAGTFYGIAFTLFCLYVHSLLPRLQDGDRKTQARFMLAYSSILMICGLYILVANAWVTQDAYIQHADFPGSPYLYVVSTFHTQPAIIVSIICQLLIDVMTSAIQVRCCVSLICNTSRAEIRPRFGVYGSFGVLLDMLHSSLCYPRSVS